MREAILHLPDDQLERIGLADVVSAARRAGLVDLTELVCHGPGGVVVFRVREPMPEDAFGDFAGVEWWERLSSSADGVTYLCKVDAPGLPDGFAPDDLGLAHDVADVRDDGLDLSVIGSHEGIGESVAAAGDAGMDLLLKSLTDYRGTGSALDALTDRQREVVETAVGMGYYEVPREATSSDVAGAVDLDPSTVAEHLQRAERNLVRRVVADRSDR